MSGLSWPVCQKCGKQESSLTMSRGMKHVCKPEEVKAFLGMTQEERRAYVKAQQLSS